MRFHYDACLSCGFLWLVREQKKASRRRCRVRRRRRGLRDLDAPGGIRAQKKASPRRRRRRPGEDVAWEEGVTPEKISRRLCCKVDDFPHGKTLEVLQIVDKNKSFAVEEMISLKKIFLYDGGSNINKRSAQYVLWVSDFRLRVSVLELRVVWDLLYKTRLFASFVVVCSEKVIHS